MPRKSLGGIQIPDLDDDILFKSEKTKQEETGERIINVKISDICDFPNHPFKVRQDREMLELADSNAKRGVSIPAIIRPKQDGKYEMVAGHRRKLGSMLIDKETLPCIVRQMSDDEAILIVADTNLRQRERLLPSEKAFAYKMKLSSMNRCGERTDLTFRQVGEKFNAVKELSKEVTDSKRQIQRYVRLTYLSQPYFRYG